MPADGQVPLGLSHVYRRLSATAGDIPDSQAPPRRNPLLSSIPRQRPPHASTSTEVWKHKTYNCPDRPGGTLATPKAPCTGFETKMHFLADKLIYASRHHEAPSLSPSQEVQRKILD